MIKCVRLYIMNKITHNIVGVLGLQNCMDILKSEPGPCTGARQISFDDGYEVGGERCEDVSDIKMKEDPWPATSTGIENEPTVSLCMCVCVCVCVCVSIVIHMAQITRISCPSVCSCLHKTA